MKHFHQVARRIDTSPVLAEIARRPHLWNANRQRKEAPGSPHLEMSDIWVRYRAIDELKEPKHFREPHESVFYPAWTFLPSLRPIVFRIMKLTEATRLGGILITKIPPGGRILPHDDKGGWHAEFYDKKVYLPLASNENCWNRCLDEEMVMKAGDVWSFDNLKVHSVENRGKTDRITCIICMRAS